MVVKDEADIVGQTLDAALTWCDNVYVFDNGSTDGTWELVREMAGRHPAIVPFASEAVPFHQGLRGTLYRHFRRRARPGDWWCKLDADEFYIDDPQTFLARILPRNNEVWSSSFQYYFTDVDARRWEADPSCFAGPGPIEERIRHYKNNWSELRFFRESPGLEWREDEHGMPIGPAPLGLFGVSPRRIRLKHYQYRSPEQIQRRLDSRLQAPGVAFRHEKRANWLMSTFGAPAGFEEPAASVAVEEAAPSWRDRVVPAELLNRDDGTGSYLSDPTALPQLPVAHRELRRLRARGMALRWRVLHR
ncbi:MAG: glycosyltransferase family 2 protein [Dehalococcoidia bacterium]